MTNQQLGQMGEDMASQLLRAKGYDILRRNYRCRAGEVDIIAERWGELCFIEVKTRQSLDYGRPCESVTREKKKHIRSVAREYLEEMKEKGYYPRGVDFQIIEIVIQQHVRAF